jgi:hypothetical protein
MFAGSTLCDVPAEASRGFLRGWYAHNSLSLKNPRLGFVCVSEDMTGDYALCGYFKEYAHKLTDDERLVFAKYERPPAFDMTQHPAHPPHNRTAWDSPRRNATMPLNTSRMVCVS